MAEFDASKTVNNILSGSGDTAQALVGTVIRTAADLAKAPGVDVARLAKLPGVGEVLGVAPALGGVLGRGAPKPKPVQKSQFSPFDIVASRGAVVMASQLMEIAEGKGGGDAGLDAAIGALGSLGELVGGVSGLAGDLVGDLTEEVSQIVRAVGADVLGMMGLRQYALRLFITHYPPAREKFKMESFEQRQPNLVRRSRARATPPEDQASYWREDAQLNDHHGHWHDVNPLSGRPVAGGDPDMGDRHGELFAYMHEQMLARYDAERLGVSLPRVQPFDKYGEKMPEGYEPGDLTVWNGQVWEGFRARPANATLSDLTLDAYVNRGGAKLEAMAKFRQALVEAARQGRYVEIKGEPIALTSDNFGDTVEANTNSVDWPVKDAFSDEGRKKNGLRYGNLHNDGHLHIGYFDNTEPYGVIMNLAAAVRDPMFWRWHKNIDTILQTWRETLGKQQPYDFADGPPVTVRSEDIILCRKEGLPADVDGEKLGAEAFGYAEEPRNWRKDPDTEPRWKTDSDRWNTDFSSKTVPLLDGKTVTTTAELMTEMRTRTIQVHDITGDERRDKDKSDKKVTEEIDYLSHDDFSYFIRLQNTSAQPQTVTIRIFLAPEPWVEDITAWIEMDRFERRLAGRERAVFFQPARLSSVIRKPAVGHDELESTEQGAPGEAWCECGWPYTLLLPRGTKEGLDFRLLVMLSSNDLDMADTGARCTSMSYCGLKDAEYPDKLPMGYPFDRSLPDSIDSIIGKHENWASRTIRIRCRNL